MGPQLLVNKAREEIAINPIFFGSTIMKEVSSERWLGDMFGANLELFLDLTITKRIAKIKRTAIEIVNIF